MILLAGLAKGILSLCKGKIKFRQGGSDFGGNFAAWEGQKPIA